METLYKFEECFGRMGSLNGLFIADSEDVKKLIGREVYFGEVLGKNSEIFLTIQESHLTQITTDQDFISKFAELECWSGYNPFDYIEEDEE